MKKGSTLLTAVVFLILTVVIGSIFLYLGGRTGGKVGGWAGKSDCESRIKDFCAKLVENNQLDKGTYEYLLQNCLNYIGYKREGCIANLLQLGPEEMTALYTGKVSPTIFADNVENRLQKIMYECRVKLGKIPGRLCVINDCPTGSTCMSAGDCSSVGGSCIGGYTCEYGCCCSIGGGGTTTTETTQTGGPPAPPS